MGAAGGAGEAAGGALLRAEEKNQRKEATLTGVLRTMCGSRTGGWSLPCVTSD
jgi:hypothetical protein